MDSLNSTVQFLADFYNRKFVAKWYTSWALWVGVIAGALPYILDYGQLLLDNLGLVGTVLMLDEATQRRIQLILVLVVLPIARALKQQGMQQAAQAQEMKVMAAAMAASLADNESLPNGAVRGE